ncbi:MAG: alpha/beta hydrolase [Xanthobacteraceae bacterium]|nr:alpha/beta hydrolase [Xanthobacteraceae bacterium]
MNVSNFLKNMMLGIAALALVTGLAGMTLYETNISVLGPRRWLGLYIWKSISPHRYTTVDGARIYYETYGNGRPVLVLHGGLSSIEGMSRQIRALVSSRYVIAPDSRGHGRSSESNAPLSYALMSDDMLELIDQLKLDQVDVVGWSDGAIIGLDLAMRHPNRVNRLVAISGNFDVSGLQASSSNTELSDTEVPPTPLSYRLLAPDPAHWPVFYGKVIEMWRTQPHYTLSDLSHIEAPTLVVAGESDLVRRDHTDQLANAIPKSQELIVQGAGHDVIYKKAPIVNSAILQFLGDN